MLHFVLLLFLAFPQLTFSNSPTRLEALPANHSVHAFWEAKGFWFHQLSRFISKNLFTAFRVSFHSQIIRIFANLSVAQTGCSAVTIKMAN